VRTYQFQLLKYMFIDATLLEVDARRLYDILDDLLVYGSDLVVRHLALVTLALVVIVGGEGMRRGGLLRSKGCDDHKNSGRWWGTQTAEETAQRI
jgi:hypothetical protein